MNDDTAQDDPQSATIAVLLDPATHGVHDVRQIETHGANVFLAGDRALKLKRAVACPYMDFSTVEKRLRACRAEIAVNRRTAPRLYLGIAPVLRRPEGGLVLGPLQEESGPSRMAAEQAVDWVVVMQRFDDEALLDRQAERGTLPVETMDALAEAIAQLHGNVDRVTDKRYGARGFEAVLTENAAEFRGFGDIFPEEATARLQESALAQLARLAPQLDRRLDQGFVRHCHGDLHLRNVVMLDGRPTLFDAIEFNDDFAMIDVLYDLAFLLMDLDHRGLRGHGNRVLNRWLEITGDDDGLAALPLFLSTRAAVRAKVTATLSRALAAEGHAGCASARQEEARRYLESAIGYLAPHPPQLLAIGGLSGSGKTTLARALAPELGRAPGAVILRSDVIRKGLHGVPPTERLPKSAYDGVVTMAVYRTIAERAAALLKAGHAVIADAVFARESERQAIAESAARAGRACFHGLWLTVPRPQLEARVAGRSGDASDAGPEVVALQSALDLGPIAWPKVKAGDSPARVADLARQCLADHVAS